MTAFDFSRWMAQRPVIGMIHLLPLPGSPQWTGSMGDVVARAVADADALVAGGCHGLMIENFGDVPFFPGRVPAVTIAAMTAVAAEVRRRSSLPLGINVLRNDGVSALAVAAAVGAAFVRVNVLTGARVTDQGLVAGIAHDLMRERAVLGGSSIKVLADVDVKHSAPLAARPLADEVADLVKRGLADGVIVSGSGTGAPVDLDKLAAVKAAAGRVPVLIGSGATAASLPQMARHADGFIVGTAFKHGGDARAAVDVARVKTFMKAHDQALW